MDLRQLRYFTACVQTGSISAAARQCKISQPSLSQQIKVLEEDLGEALLIRQTRGVVPTAAGKLLHTHAERLLREEEMLRAQFSQRSNLQSGSLTFGIIPTIAPYLLPRILGPFRQLYPSIKIAVQENQTAELIDSVAKGELEFAILSDVAPEAQNRSGLEIMSLFREELVLAAPSSHDLALASAKIEPSTIPVDELIHLRDGHCLTEQTLQACSLTQLNPDLRCDQLETALAMVRSGLGIAIVPAFAVRNIEDNAIVFRSFTSEQPQRAINLMTRSGSAIAPPAQALIDSLALAFARQQKIAS